MFSSSLSSSKSILQSIKFWQSVNFESLANLSIGQPIKFSSIDDSFVDYLPQCTFTKVTVYSSPISESIPEKVLATLKQLPTKYPIKSVGFFKNILGIAIEQITTRHLEILLEGQKNGKGILVLMSYTPERLQNLSYKLTGDAQKQVAIKQLSQRKRKNEPIRSYQKQVGVTGQSVKNFLERFFNSNDPPKYNILNNNSSHFVEHFLREVWSVQ